MAVRTALCVWTWVLKSAHFSTMVAGYRSLIGAGYTLLLDLGCLHGLTPAKLQQAAATITDVAEPGARLLMFAFAPGRRGPAPRGIDPAQLPALFPRWDLAFSRPASEITLRGPMRNANPSWHQLVKR